MWTILSGILTIAGVFVGFKASREEDRRREEQINQEVDKRLKERLENPATE